VLLGGVCGVRVLTATRKQRAPSTKLFRVYSRGASSWVSGRRAGGMCQSQRLVGETPFTGEVETVPIRKQSSV